jgi:3-oxoacyl-[acyl-carrier-protein] synthase II
MSSDIVITGMGIVSPIGCGEAAFWNALTSGRSGAAPVTGFDTSELTRTVACQVRDQIHVACPLLGDHGSKSGSMGRASKLAVAAAHEAMQGSGLDDSSLDGARPAVIMGTTMGETEFIEAGLDMPAAQWLDDAHLARIAQGRPGCIAANIRDALHLSAPSCDLYGACAAGNMALASARQRLLNDECDVVLAGGADGFSWLAFIGFMRLRVMADGVCRPFDQRRDGLLVGEGAVVLVLEREQDAKARSATIRARVLGAGVACENYHPTRPHPDGDGLTRATRAAIADASLTPEDIDYVCAHGTGTPQNDAIEVKVLEHCFQNGVAFSSVKALTGHTMGAAAAVEAAACVLMLEHQQLIPTWHLEDVLQPCSLDAIKGAVRDSRVRCVLNNSAGFGGYNSSIALAAP